MSAYIDAHRERFGVEPICRALQVAPSTYYAARRGRPRPRARRDERAEAADRRVYGDNYGVYGADKVWAQLHREGIRVARCTVERLMRAAGPARARCAARPGAPRSRDERGGAARDLVERHFRRRRPNRLWVADLTYVRTWSGFVYVAFIVDVFSRRIVGWQALHAPAHRPGPGRAGDGALAAPRPSASTGWCTTPTAAPNTSSIRYTERLAAAGARAARVGSPRRLATTTPWPRSTIGLYKTELVRRRGPWRGLDDLELATLEWVDWFNHRRLHSEIGNDPARRAQRPTRAHYTRPTQPPESPLKTGAVHCALWMSLADSSRFAPSTSPYAPSSLRGAGPRSHQ